MERKRDGKKLENDLQPRCVWSLRPTADPKRFIQETGKSLSSNRGSRSFTDE